MSAASVIILLIIGFIYFTYRRLKEFPKFNIESALARHDYQHALELLDGVGATKLLSKLEHDTYVMKCYFMLGNHDAFVKQVNFIGSNTYKEGKKAVLEKWYYHCIRTECKEFANIFLDTLKEDSLSYQMATYAYQVVFDHNIQLLSTLDALISKQTNVTFYTGLAYYLRGIIFYHQNAMNQALHSFDAALCNFDAIHSDIFYKQAKRFIDQYGNSNFVHYGDQASYDFHIKEIDMVKTYRYTPKQKHHK